MDGLTHFTAKPFEFDPTRTYEQSARNMKPRGLWLSVDGEHNWEQWCRSEEYGLGGLEHRTRVFFEPGSRILSLSTEADLLAFTVAYGGKMTREFLWIDWPRVATEWDGMVISPYQWSLRYSGQVSWYYTWDCASACVWNLAAVNIMALR
jgi:hypothetical protein